jgi:hypothetical protein
MAHPVERSPHVTRLVLAAAASLGVVSIEIWSEGNRP